MKLCRVCRSSNISASRAARKDWICTSCSNQKIAATADAGLKPLVAKLRAYLKRHRDIPEPPGGCTAEFVGRVVDTHPLPDGAAGDVSNCVVVFDEFNNPELILASESKAHSYRRRKRKKELSDATKGGDLI